MDSHRPTGMDHNKVYDLMHLAGVGIHQMRLCQPYGDDQRKGLWLFKCWSRKRGPGWLGVCRRPISAIVMWNFLETCSAISASAFRKGTWRSYAEFLLDTMPPPTAEHYREKINTFLKWWTKHGFKEIPQEADPKLEVPPQGPSWRRICKEHC